MVIVLISTGLAYCRLSLVVHWLQRQSQNRKEKSGFALTIFLEGECNALKKAPLVLNAG